MTVNNAPSSHVVRVAKLVRLLNQEEIRQLIQLVPQLQVEQKAIATKRAELVQWAREQMAQYAPQARPMQSQDMFLNDITVEEYFSLSEAERERIWDELYTTAIETMKEREVNPGGVVPAG